VNTSRSGEKGIDFDILAGQEVQLNNDFMDSLERSAISSTGVPSVMMNYINEADYAKTLVMANSKFLARVIHHQLSFNDSTTELYKKVMTFGSNIPKEIIASFVFTFNPPKTLSNVNMTDLINNSDQIVNYMMDAVTGKNSGGGDDDNLIKDEVYKQIVKEVLPMLPWSKVDEILKEVKLNLPKIKKEKEQSQATPAEGQ
jgi:hypothetical protein